MAKEMASNRSSEEKRVPRIGVVGGGHMGIYHINVLKSFHDAGDVDFVGFYEVDEARRQTISKDYRLRGYDSMEALAAEVEGLVLATPTSTHYVLAKKILEAGVHILIEKPLCPSLDEAEELCRLAQKQNCVLQVGHVERYNAAVQELDHLVKRPYCWESRRVGPGSMRISDTGVGLDLLIHDIDICLRTLRSEVTHVKSTGMTVNEAALKQATSITGDRGEGIFRNIHEDALSAQLTFANGCLATFFVTRLSHRKERLLTITDKAHTLLLDFTTQELDIHSIGESEIKTSPEKIRYAQQSSVQRIFVHKANPLELELRDFMRAVQKGEPTDNSKDLKALAVTLQIIEQAKAQWG